MKKRSNADTSKGAGREEQNGENTMNTELHELFLDELADLLSAETQLTKALPKMAKAAKSQDLAEAFRSHLAETENHVERLKSVFTSVGAKAKSKTCKATKGLVEEAAELMQEWKG